MSTSDDTGTEWHRVAVVGDLDDGRVMTVTVDRRSLALSRVGDEFGALDNHCPHQGGPLGEGSIENGLLRCPWHGYDYDPLTGQPPSGFDDAPTCFAVETRGEEVWVELPVRRADDRTFSDVLVETLVNWGSRWSSAWSDIPTSDSPTRCVARRNAANCATSGSATREPRPSLRVPTES